MSDTSERLIYSNNVAYESIRVSAARCLVNGRSYSINDIELVYVIRPIPPLVTYLFVVSCFFCVAAFFLFQSHYSDYGYCFLAAGTPFFLFCFKMWLIRDYELWIQTEVGDQVIFISKNQKIVAETRAAIQAAINFKRRNLIRFPIKRNKK
jgi:hypothetical protein